MISYWETVNLKSDLELIQRVNIEGLKESRD